MRSKRWPALYIPLLDALAFLTRLAPARAADPAALAASMAAYPAVGLILGLLGAALAWPLAARSPWLAAWAWLAAQLWLTRGLHHDGLADVADAWGSGARGEAFLRILKDSRLGAFGAMGLFLGMSGQLFTALELARAGAWGVLIFAPVWGRALAVALAWVGRAHRRDGLAGLFLQQLGAGHTAIALVSAAGLGLVLAGPAVVLTVAILSAAPLWGLAKLGRERGGLGGDFLGTAILAGELAVGFGWLLLQV